MLMSFIALTAVFSVLFVGFGAILDAKIGPLTKRMDYFESEIKEIRTDITDIKALLYQRDKQTKAQ